MTDHHKFPKARKPNEGRSSKSTTQTRQYQPAQVYVSVDTTPHAKTVAEPKLRRTTGDIVGVDKMDVAVDTNTVKLANTYYMQVLKNNTVPVLAGR